MTETDSIKRLQYKAPHPTLYPTAFFFLLFIYIMLVATPNEDYTHILVPDYLRRMAETYESLPQDSTARGFYEIAYRVCFFFEEHLADHFFMLGMFLFRSYSVMQMILAGAFLIHCLELGVCVNICRSTNATLGTTLLYALGTALGGFTQLHSLLLAREEYLTSMTTEGKDGSVVEKDAQSKKKD